MRVYIEFKTSDHLRDGDFDLEVEESSDGSNSKSEYEFENDTIFDNEEIQTITEAEEDNENSV